MNIRYTEEKCFTPEQVQALFRSVGWVSGEYPSRLYKALVHPDYHGQGISGAMIEQVKAKYRDFLYLEIMPEERKNAAFYQRFGFRVMEDGVPMQLCNFANKV